MQPLCGLGCMRQGKEGWLCSPSMAQGPQQYAERAERAEQVAQNLKSWHFLILTKATCTNTVNFIEVKPKTKTLISEKVSKGPILDDP